MGSVTEEEPEIRGLKIEASVRYSVGVRLWRLG